MSRIFPKTLKEMTNGMMYFPRMLDKIRLHLQRKREMGIADRDDIQCIPDLIDFDEGRIK